MDVTKLFNKLIAITSDLTTLMERENTALNLRDADGVKALAQEKNALSRAYLAHVRELSKDPEAIAQMDESLRERLLGIGENIRGLMEENSKLLQVAIETNRRVVDVIAEAAKEAHPRAGTYSANGAVSDGAPGTAPRNVAVSVDQSL